VRPSPEPRSDLREGGSEDLDLAHLSVGELLVIWALRMRLARGPSGPVAGFRLAFGLAGIEAALASFEGLSACCGAIAAATSACTRRAAAASARTR
jgi:hypothetical protein